MAHANDLLKHEEFVMKIYNVASSLKVSPDSRVFLEIYPHANIWKTPEGITSNFAISWPP